MLVLSGEPGNVTHLAFSPDAKLLAASSDRIGLEMWNVPARRKWGRYTHIQFANAPATFHPTEPLCFAQAHNGLALIDTNAETVRVVQPPFGHSFVRFAMVPADMRFVARVWALGADEVQCYRLQQGNAKKPLARVWKVPLEWPTPNARFPLEIGAIVAAPDGKTFATLSGKRGANWTVKPMRVNLRAVAGGKVLQFAEVPAGTINALAFGPSGRTFVTCRTHILSVWQVADLSAPPREVRSDSRQHFTAIAFHPSGRYLAATSSDATVKLYDTTTWEVTRAFTWDIGRMRSVAFSPDGTLAAAGSDSGKVVIWDVDF